MGPGLDLGVDRDFTAIRTYGVKAFPVVFVIGRDGTVEAIHGRNRNRSTRNGLDNLETELRAELNLLLAGRGRAELLGAVKENGVSLFGTCLWLQPDFGYTPARRG